MHLGQSRPEHHSSALAGTVYQMEGGVYSFDNPIAFSCAEMNVAHRCDITLAIPLTQSFLTSRSSVDTRRSKYVCRFFSSSLLKPFKNLYSGDLHVILIHSQKIFLQSRRQNRPPYTRPYSAISGQVSEISHRAPFATASIVTSWCALLLHFLKLIA